MQTRPVHFMFLVTSQDSTRVGGVLKQNVNEVVQCGMLVCWSKVTVVTDNMTHLVNCLYSHVKALLILLLLPHLFKCSLICQP